HIRLAHGDQYVIGEAPQAHNVPRYAQLIAAYDIPAVVVVLREDDLFMQKIFPYWEKPLTVDGRVVVSSELKRVAQLKDNLVSYTHDLRVRRHPTAQEYTHSVTFIVYSEWPDYEAPQGAGPLITASVYANRLAARHMEDPAVQARCASYREAPGAEANVASRMRIPRMSMMHLFEETDEEEGGYTCPIMSHCSAGLGRSSTFVALSHLVPLVTGQGIPPPTSLRHCVEMVMETVMALRLQRNPSAIQSCPQFKFLLSSVVSEWRQAQTDRETL
ncbi:hypothetical protein KIPB_004092, partial [Kipferlia bialata]